MVHNFPGERPPTDSKWTFALPHDFQFLRFISKWLLMEDTNIRKNNNGEASTWVVVGVVDEGGTLEKCNLLQGG